MEKLYVTRNSLEARNSPQMPIFYIRQNLQCFLYTKTWQRKPHFMFFLKRV